MRVFIYVDTGLLLVLVLYVRAKGVFVKIRDVGVYSRVVLVRVGPAVGCIYEHVLIVNRRPTSSTQQKATGMSLLFFPNNTWPYLLWLFK